MLVLDRCGVRHFRRAGDLLSPANEAAVLFVNQSFYEAFSARDVAAMEAIWSSREPVLCTHPGWPPLIGRKAVIESWQQILGNAGAPKVRCAEAKVHFSEGVAIVTCYELLEHGTLVATNLFMREGDDWKLMHHHASPTPRGPQATEPEPANDPTRKLN